MSFLLFHSFHRNGCAIDQGKRWPVKWEEMYTLKMKKEKVIANTY